MVYNKLRYSFKVNNKQIDLGIMFILNDCKWHLDNDFEINGLAWNLCIDFNYALKRLVCTEVQR